MRLTDPFRWIFQALIAVLGMGAYFLILAIVVLSLPFNVIALMRIFGWEWWSALLAAVFVSVIPVLGQLAYIGLAIAGAIYFYQANFDWRAAVYREQKTISVADMTDEQFDTYRKSVSPEIERGCKGAAAKKYAVDGKLPVAFSKYCECVGQTAATVFSRSDFEYEEANGRMSDDADARLKSAVIARCGGG